MNPSLIERCAEIAREFGVTRLVLFGSAAESPETARDVDLACEGLEGWDLFRFGARLEEELRRPVDVVPIRPENAFSQYVARRGRVIYESKGPA